MAEYRKLPIPNYDIETAALENDEEAVRAYTNQVSKYMIELYRSMQYVTLESVLEKELLNSTYCIEKVEKESPVQFFIGFYAGILRMIKVAVKENHKQLNIQECLKELEWEISRIWHKFWKQYIRHRVYSTENWLGILILVQEH